MEVEKRTAKRVPYPCEVECYNLGTGVSPLNPRLSDLSAKGAFIDSINPLPVGSVVKLKFHTPTLLIDVRAQVAQTMPQFGMGVRFLDLTPQQQTAIDAIVEGPP
jgi:hypothetical protein